MKGYELAAVEGVRYREGLEFHSGTGNQCRKCARWVKWYDVAPVEKGRRKMRRERLRKARHKNHSKQPSEVNRK